MIDIAFMNPKPSAKAFINHGEIKHTFSLAVAQEHVTGATQKKGHTLDLVITREANPPVIGNLSVIDGISDHSAVLGKVHLHRPPNSDQSGKIT